MNKKLNIQDTIKKDVKQFLIDNHFSIEYSYRYNGSQYMFSEKSNDSDISDYDVERFLENNNVLSNIRFVELYIKDKIKNNQTDYLKKFMKIHLTNVSSKYDFKSKEVQQICSYLMKYPSLVDYLENNQIISKISIGQFIDCLTKIKNQESKNNLLIKFISQNEKFKESYERANYLDNLKDFWKTIKEKELFPKQIISEVFSQFEKPQTLKANDLQALLRKNHTLYTAYLQLENLNQIFQTSEIKDSMKFNEFLSRCKEVVDLKVDDIKILWEFSGVHKANGLDFRITSSKIEHLDLVRLFIYEHIENILFSKEMNIHDLWNKIKTENEMKTINHALGLEAIMQSESQMKKPKKI